MRHNIDLITVEEARTNANNSSENHKNSEWDALCNRIYSESRKGRLYTVVEGRIYQENKRKLEEVGYKVQYTSDISWGGNPVDVTRISWEK